MDWSRLMSIIIGGIIGWNFDRIAGFFRNKRSLKGTKLKNEGKKSN